MKHILVPIDFSDHSLHALAYAEKLAQQNGGTLTLLTVVEPLPGWQDVPLAIAPDQLSRDAEARLQKLVSQRHLDPRLIGRVIVRVGTPWDEITRAARDLDRDLIVIATQGDLNVGLGTAGVWRGFVLAEPCGANWLAHIAIK